MDCDEADIYIIMKSQRCCCCEMPSRLRFTTEQTEYTRTETSGR